VRPRRARFDSAASDSDRIEPSTPSHGSTDEKKSSEFPPPPHPHPPPPSFMRRTVMTFVMLFAFGVILSVGHIYVALLVLLINIAMFREIISLRRSIARRHAMPYAPLLDWYFFFVTANFLYGRIMRAYISVDSKLLRVLHPPPLDALQPLLPYHTFSSFFLYIAGLSGGGGGV
jgi:hypothetical protein